LTIFGRIKAQVQAALAHEHTLREKVATVIPAAVDANQIHFASCVPAADVTAWRKPRAPQGDDHNAPILT
jgi:hypothetical protein